MRDDSRTATYLFLLGLRSFSPEPEATDVLRRAAHNIRRLRLRAKRGTKHPGDIAQHSTLGHGLGVRIVVYAVLVIGVLNFLVGYAVAVYLERGPAPRPKAPPVALEQPIELVEETEADRFQQRIELQREEFVRQVQEEEPEVEPIPSDWLDILEQESVEANSFIEASVQILRLEVGKYREALLDVEDAVRTCQAAANVESLEGLLKQLKDLNQDWLDKQSDAVGHLQSRGDGLGDFSKMGGELETVLLEQAAQIETTLSNLDLMDFSSDAKAGCDRLLDEICRLVDLAHALRDRMHESLLLILKAENRLEQFDRRLQFDGLTTLHNRSGLEVIFEDWWREDSVRERLISVVMLDIDHFAKFNEQFGTRGADRLLAAFGPLLADLVRKDRGFDVATRYGSERFVLFFGDTGPNNATGGAERIRQTIEATTFEYHEKTIELTVSCGVTEVLKDDDTHSLFKRLSGALRAAKKGGRNATFVDKGDGPTAVHPPEFQVAGHVVRVHDV